MSIGINRLTLIFTDLCLVESMTLTSGPITNQYMSIDINCYQLISVMASLVLSQAVHHMIVLSA